MTKYLISYLKEDIKRMSTAIRSKESKRILGEGGVAQVKAQIQYAKTVLRILGID